MHLALLTPEWSAAGGIATYCRALARYAAAGGHRVTVLAPVEARADRLPGVHLVTVPTAGLDAGSVACRFRDAFTDLLVAGDRPDVVEAAEFGGVAALLPAVASAPPLVTRLHTPLALLLRRNHGQPVYRDDAERCALESRQVHGSALVTSPSRWLAGQARRLWRLPETPVVVPNPVDLRPADPRAARRPGPARLLYLGRLEYRKGVLTLAAALRRWWQAGGAGEMTFVGADTRWRGVPMSQRIRERLGPFSRPPWCRFAGVLDPCGVGAELDAADLVVLPSRYENFPYACLEAMSRATPVLATTGSGFAEIVEPDITGRLVPPGNVTALAQALGELAGDVDRLRAMGQRAGEAVLRFAPERCAAVLLDLFAGVAAGSPDVRRPGAGRVPAYAGPEPTSGLEPTNDELNQT